MTTAPWSSSNVSPSSVTSIAERSASTSGGAVETTASAALRVVAGRRRGERIARRERLGDGLVVGVAVVDAEAGERVEERLLRLAERHAVLRTARPGERRLDRREVELDDLRVGRRLVRVVPERVLLAVRLDERDPLGRAARQAQVAKRLGVDREEAARRAVLGRHVPDRRAVGERQPGRARGRSTRRTSRRRPPRAGSA